MRLRRSLILTVAMLVAVPSVASAWTQQLNEYPGNPTSCTEVAPYYCIEWPKTANNLSVNVDVYLHSSLTAITTVNLKTDARNAWPRWNGIAARNPHLQETTSTASDEAHVYLGSLPNNVYATTTVTYLRTSPNNITHADMRFNSAVFWNNSLDFSSFQLPNGETRWRADSRKVMTHEFGHAEGLGHTGIDPAIMRSGATNYYTVQANDRAGIIAIYGAYP